MDTRKFEYLETMRDTIVEGAYEALLDYVRHIQPRVKHDPDFEDIFIEVNRGRYSEVLSLIDDMIYRDMQNEMAAIQEEEEDAMDSYPEDDVEKLGKILDLDEDIEEEISMEPFDEDSFLDKFDDGL